MGYIANHIHAIRDNFPALSHKIDGKMPLYFDGPGGSQLPKCVIDAMSKYLITGNSNMGGYNGAGKNTTHINDTARTLAGLWLGANKDEIVFGLNATSLMFHVSRSVARDWQAGDVIILSEIEHYSHVSSWEQVAKDKGVIVKKIPLNSSLTDLDYDSLDEMICPKTRLVAVSYASNVIGTVIDVPKIIKKAKAVGAWVSVDAVHGAVHLPIDVKALDVDFLFASAYKLGGGHLGMMYAKQEHLSTLKPYKVTPATDVAPMSWEQGTQSFEAQAGLVALMNYWTGLSGQQVFDGHGILGAYREIVAYEQALTVHVLQKFAKRDNLILYGKHDSNGRTPTFAFNVLKNGQIMDGVAISQALGEQNIALGYGNFYAQSLCHALSPTGAVLRLGCLHYTTVCEIDVLFDELDKAIDKM